MNEPVQAGKHISVVDFGTGVRPRRINAMTEINKQQS